MKRMPIHFLLLWCLIAQADSRWEYDAGGMVSGNAMIREGRIYVSGGTFLSVLDRNGNLQWRYDAQAKTFSSVAFGEKLVYLLADNGLHALDLTGRRLWHFGTQDEAREVEGRTMGWGEGSFPDPWALYRSAPLVLSGKVVFGNAHGTWAVDADSGEVIWHAKSGVTHTRPAHFEGIVVVGSWDNYLYGLDLSDGSVAWKAVSRLPQGEMAGWMGWEGFNLDPVVHEGVVYVGSRGTHFYAIDARTGKEKWSAKHPSSWVGSAAIVSDGVIYFGMSDGYSLLGLETRMGNQALFFRNNFYNFARPQANASHVFLASLSGELFAVDKATGSGRRIFATRDSAENLAEVLYPGGGQNFVHSAKGGFTHENAVKDVQRMLSKLDSLLSLTLDDGVLYAGSANGKLYAIPVR